MSRKNRRHKINKTKFKDTVCSKCALCKKGINPKFCYNFLYKKNPGKFTGTVFPKMMAQLGFLDQIMKLTPDELQTSIVGMSAFRAVFCTSKLCIGCDKDVNTVLTCISQFRSQELKNPMYKLIQKTFGPNRLSRVERKAIKKAKRAAIKKKNAPKVTIITSDNEEFRAEVHRILENNLKQPDKN